VRTVIPGPPPPPEQKAPASLPDLVKKTKDTDKQIADNKKSAAAYAQENVSGWNQISDILAKNGKVPANLQKVASEREKFNQNDRDLKKALAEAKDAQEREKRIVQLSVGNEADIDTMPGEMFSKTVDLDLTIGGQVQRYVMGLRKYELQRTGGTGRMVHQPCQHARAIEGRGQLEEHLAVELLRALPRQRLEHRQPREFVPVGDGPPVEGEQPHVDCALQSFVGRRHACAHDLDLGPPGDD